MLRGWNAVLGNANGIAQAVIDILTRGGLVVDNRLLEQENRPSPQDPGGGVAGREVFQTESLSAGGFSQRQEIPCGSVSKHTGDNRGSKEGRKGSRVRAGELF